jgi:hypothetical protein
MAAAEQKISAVLEKELDYVDKNCIRPIQVKAFQCCAKCSEDKMSSQATLQNCLQNCMRPVAESEDKIKQEIENFQGRLTRCAQSCQDRITDSLPANPSQGDRERATKEAETCLLKCADEHIPLMTKVFVKIRQQLNTCS